MEKKKRNLVRSNLLLLDILLGVNLVNIYLVLNDNVDQVFACIQEPL